MHEYNDLLFHLFADQVMDPEQHGASPESDMWGSLVLFMKENLGKVEQISHEFLKKRYFIGRLYKIHFCHWEQRCMSLCCTYCASCKAYITVLSPKHKFL